MRLPDIRYDREVRPLAKEDPNDPLKRAQIEIDLSKAQLGADLGAAGKIGAANIRLAKLRGDVDKQAIQDQTNINVAAFNFNSQQDLRKDLVTAQVVGNLAQTAVRVGARWYAANEEAKVASGVTKYSAGMSQLSTELAKSRTIDLDKYGDVDFSSIPENMIYEGTDALTGQKVRTAPNHLAAPLVFASREAAIRAAAAEDITSEISRAQFENGTSRMAAASLSTVVKAKYDHEQNFLSGQYEESLQEAINQEDLSTAVDIINSAEARGVWKSGVAGEKRAGLQGDIKFTSLIRKADNATSLAQLKDVKEAAYDLPKSEQISVRAVIGRRESKIEADIEKAKVIRERTELAQNTETAMEVGMAEKGFEPGRAAIKKMFAKQDPENLSHYLSSWRTRWNQSKNAEAARVTELTDQNAEEIFKDPSTPIHPDVTGTNVMKLEKVRAQARSGTAPVTNMNRWNDLYNMAVNSPEKFAKLSIGAEKADLSEGDFKYFKNLQQEMKSGSYTPTQVQAASAQFNSMAKQAYGNRYDQKEEVGALRQAYINSVEQLEESKGAKSTTSERQGLLNDLFSAQVKTYDKGFFGMREEEGSLIKSEAKPYIPQLSAILKANKIPVTAGNIAKQFNFMLKNGTLEELEY